MERPVFVWRSLIAADAHHEDIVTVAQAACDDLAGTELEANATAVLDMLKTDGGHFSPALQDDVDTNVIEALLIERLSWLVLSAVSMKRLLFLRNCLV